jgi:hypothetical protein
MTMTKNAALALGRHHSCQSVECRLDTDGRRRGGSAFRRQGASWLQDAVATRPFGRLLLPADIAMAAA